MKKLIAIYGLMLISFAASAAEFKIEETLRNDKNEIVQTRSLNKKTNLLYYGHITEIFAGPSSIDIRLEGKDSVSIDQGEVLKSTLRLTIEGKGLNHFDSMRFMGQDVQINSTSESVNIESDRSQILILK